MLDLLHRWETTIKRYPNSPFTETCGSAKSIPTPINQLQRRFPDPLKLCELLLPLWGVLGVGSRGVFQKHVWSFLLLVWIGKKQCASFCCTTPLAPTLLAQKSAVSSNANPNLTASISEKKKSSSVCWAKTGLTLSESALMSSIFRLRTRRPRRPLMWFHPWKRGPTIWNRDTL